MDLGLGVAAQEWPPLLDPILRVRPHRGLQACASKIAGTDLRRPSGGPASLPGRRRRTYFSPEVPPAANTPTGCSGCCFAIAAPMGAQQLSPGLPQSSQASKSNSYIQCKDCNSFSNVRQIHRGTIAQIYACQSHKKIFFKALLDQANLTQAYQVLQRAQKTTRHLHPVAIPLHPALRNSLPVRPRDCTQSSQLVICDGP